jgi:hypothetical protein
MHDIDGFMDATAWKSDKLATTLDGHMIRGWRQILAAYHQGYTDLSSMGSVEYSSLGTNLLNPDLALVLFGWTQTIDGKKTIGSSSMLAAKFPFGWRIISNDSDYHMYTPVQPDPRHLRPGKIVPFALQNPLTTPEDFLLNGSRHYQEPVRLTLSLEK